MITDPIFYRLFKTSPETFFLMLGMSPESADEMAARYQFQAIEFKETAHRADGVFLPNELGLPLYFLEAQFYHLPSVYADLLAKVFTYLKQHDPAQTFRGVVLFASRAMEPKDVEPYRPLLESGYVQRYYLDELPAQDNAPLGLSILYLIREVEDRAASVARDLIVRARAEVGDESLRDDLIELIETVIINKLSRLSREEIQAMLQVHDIRETRVYQEALQEGFKEGKEEGLAEAVAKLAAKKLPVKQIAELLDMDVKKVRQLLRSASK